MICKRIAILIVVFFLGAWSVEAATEVLLKNGEVIRGSLVRIEETRIELRVGSGQTKFTLVKEDIKNINGVAFEEFRLAYKTASSLYAGDTKEAFEASFKEAVQLVEKKRQIKFLKDVTKKVFDEDKLREYLEEKLSEEYSEEALEKERKLLVVLGLIDEDLDYKKAILEMYTDNIAGLYDVEEDTLYVMEDIKSSIAPLLPSEVMTHELMHALQDQTFELDKLRETMKEVSSDEALSYQSVIEGEAVFVSYGIGIDLLDKVSQGTLKDDMEGFDFERFILETMLSLGKSGISDDTIFLEVMLFPYVRGAIFMKYAFDSGGWEKVNQVYKSMPVSTEQILHPEKYFLFRDDPLPLSSIKPNIDETFKQVSSCRLGELTFYMVGKKFLDELFARMVSEGWGNDQYYLFQKDDKQVFLSHSRWDSANDAREFILGYKKILDKKNDGVEWQDLEGFSYGKIESGLVYLGRDKDYVLIIEAEIEDKEILDKFVKECSFPFMVKEEVQEE